jgi:predicted phage terminase large subunit-like protein
LTNQPQSRSRIYDLMESSLVVLGKVVSPQMFSVPSAKFHHEISSTLLDLSKTLINVIAPRGHAKSSLVAAIMVIHHIMFFKGPKFIVLVSKTETHAIGLLMTIKNMLNHSQNLAKYFGYWGEHSAQIWNQTEVVLKDGTKILCKGTGQQVVGLKHINQRPTLIILDDPEDLANTKTIEAMEYNLKWLLTQLVPSRDPQRGRVIVVGTPQHQRSMVQTLTRTKKWKTLHYSAIKPDGTALWPEWWPLAKLMEEKEMYESIGKVSMFYREYMCQITGDDEALFLEKDLRYWNGELFYQTASDGEKNAFLRIANLKNYKKEIIQTYDPPKVVPVNITTGIDPASSVTAAADYSVIFNQAVDKDKNRFTLPYFRKRVRPLELANTILENFKKYNSSVTRIESTGYQEMLRDWVREHEYMPGLEVKETPRTSKSNRLEQLQPLFAQGKIYVMENQTELIDELLLFPRAKNDDTLDGLYYANRKIYLPVHDFVVERRPETVIEAFHLGMDELVNKNDIDNQYVSVPDDDYFIELSL